MADRLDLLGGAVQVGEPIGQRRTVADDERRDLLLLFGFEHETLVRVGHRLEQRQRQEVVAGVDQQRLDVGEPVLVHDELVVRLDQRHPLAVDAQDELVAVSPVAAVGDGEHGRAVQREVHDARQVPDPGDQLRLAGAVLTVSLRQQRRPFVATFLGQHAARQVCLHVLVHIVVSCQNTPSSRHSSVYLVLCTNNSRQFFYCYQCHGFLVMVDDSDR